MNILFTRRLPFINAGGVGTVTETLAAEFVRRGIGVFYLSFSVGGHTNVKGIEQYFLPDSVMTSERNLNFLAKFLLEHQIDIIINQAAVTEQKILQMLSKAKKPEIKLITVHHNSIKGVRDSYKNIIRASYSNSKVYPLINNRLGFSLLQWYSIQKYSRYFNDSVMLSDKFVLLSDRFISELKPYINNNLFSKVSAISNPSNFDIVDGIESEKENRLIYVGRVEAAQKNTGRLLKIWKELQNEYKSWHLDIVGDGELLPALKEDAIKMGLKRIHFYGYTDPRPFLRKAKILLMTSDFEGFPMVLVEAQAYGSVPIAFKCTSAIDDIIQHGKSGIIIQHFDDKKYLYELINLMKDDEKRKKILVNGQKSIAKFNVVDIAERWLELFKTLA